MITSKMPLRSEDLVNQTALTLPEREMMDTYTWGQSIDQTNTATVDVDNDGNSQVLVQQENQAQHCLNLAINLLAYSDYNDAELEDIYQDCMQDQTMDKDNDQDIDDEDKKKHKKHR